MLLMKHVVLLLILSFFFSSVVGQEQEKGADIQVKLKQGEIILDGILDEPSWQSAQVISGFYQYAPNDTIPALGETEIRVTYDDEFVYLSAKCYSKGNKFQVPSLRRDYGFRATDNISFMLDAFNDKTNAYLFGMNAFGAQREAWISNGGRGFRDFDPSWDNKWEGESKIYDDHWICEVAIPLKIIKYKEGTKYFRFNAYRNDTQHNEMSIWVQRPRQIILMDMNFMGRLYWEKELENSTPNIAVIPYITGSVTRDFEDLDQTSPKVTGNTGLDAKFSIGTNLNLDVTINPDFSQVEVDRQVTNLDRFEIFFPERRQFFLENADLFGSFGARFLNPFFSRRIGVGIDTLTGNNIQNAIPGGIRLTGKLTDDFRLGVMSIQSSAQSDNDLPSYNYSVVAAEQRVFDRSTIAALVINKQAINYDDFGETNDAYDRTLGLEYRIRSKNNYWSGKSSVFKSLTPNEEEHKFSSFNFVRYNRRKYAIDFEGTVIGNGFDAEVGFVPRKDVLVFGPGFTYRTFPSKGAIVQNQYTIQARNFYKLAKDGNENFSSFGLEEQSLSFQYNAQMQDLTRLEANVQYNKLFLLNDFDPTRIQNDDIFFSAGRVFENLSFQINYNTNRAKPFSAGGNFLVGKFFDGTRYQIRGEASYRFIPYGTITLESSFNRIDLEDPFETANLWLVSPRFDFTFTRAHFLSCLIQYNSQLDNLGLNARYQWRFAPASDLFVVYSDNLLMEGLQIGESRNRGIVLKMSYWLSL